MLYRLIRSRQRRPQYTNVLSVSAVTLWNFKTRLPAPWNWKYTALAATLSVLVSAWPSFFSQPEIHSTKRRITWSVLCRWWKTEVLMTSWWKLTRKSVHNWGGCFFFSYTVNPQHNREQKVGTGNCLRYKRCFAKSGDGLFSLHRVHSAL